MAEEVYEEGYVPESAPNGSLFAAVTTHCLSRFIHSSGSVFVILMTALFGVIYVLKL